MVFLNRLIEHISSNMTSFDSIYVLHLNSKIGTQSTDPVLDQTILGDSNSDHQINDRAVGLQMTSSCIKRSTHFFTCGSVCTEGAESPRILPGNSESTDVIS